MSLAETRSLPVPSPLTSVARAVALIKTLAEVYAEAQAMADAAHKRYSFMDC
jgi:hypothetical protein